MPKNVPTPVAAVLGIVPSVLDSARRLPGRAVQIPVLAVSTALGALETARREYADLAERGERVVARVRGGSFDGMEDWADTVLEDTPLAKPYEAVEQAVEDAVSKVTGLLDLAAQKLPAKLSSAVAETVANPEELAASVAATTVEHDALPLADYDRMTLGSLRGRLRSLSVPELVQVLDYEKGHAGRLPVVTLLDHRLAKLATEEAAAQTAPAKKAPAKKAPAKKAAPRA